MSPLIWTFVRKGERPIAVFHTSLPYETDYRAKFVAESGEVEFHRFRDVAYERFELRSETGFLGMPRRWYLKKRDRRSFVGKRYRHRFFDCSQEIDFLRSRGVSRCVFEWGTPFLRGEVIERFFMAAKGTGIATFALPHGCNINTNPDVNTGYRRSAARGRVPDSSDRNLYDYYVVQNPTRRDQLVRWGYDPLRTQAWGSPRFYPEWQRINLSHSPEFTPANESGGRLRLVFMQHQRNYNIHQERIWQLLERLALTDWIHLVVKWSTREGKDYPSRSFEDRYGRSGHVESAPSSAHSPALIAWSDAVINFGSSIGMEAVLQEKPLITPTHLHDNRTLFEELGAALVASNDEEVFAHLAAIRSGAPPAVSEQGRDALIREIVYGGRAPHDVLESYYQKLTAPLLAY